MQKKKGISLIVLVITIIVMIVLAGAIILSLNNAGIIEKANQAVSSTDEATVKEIAQMAWAEAYADGVRTVEDLEDGTKGFQSRVNAVLVENKIDTKKYRVMATTQGIDVVVMSEIKEPWEREGLKIKRGEEELTIGQTVKYTATGTDYSGDWKVLGTDEAGNLLIMSATDVKKQYQLGSSNLSKSQEDWLQGTSKLNDICKPFGNGNGAIGARSIRVEDIDKITGYNKPTTVGKNIYSYGNEVTYLYNGSTLPSYKGINGVEGSLGTVHSSGFYYYDGTEFKHISNLTTGTNGEAFAKLTCMYYSYVGSTFLSTSTEAYKMLFGTSDNWNYYWVADSYVITGSSVANFGMMRIVNGELKDGALFLSNGSTGATPMGVRAVVTISFNVTLADLI